MRKGENVGVKSSLSSKYPWGTLAAMSTHGSMHTRQNFHTEGWGFVIPSGSLLEWSINSLAL